VEARDHLEGLAVLSSEREGETEKSDVVWRDPL